MQVWLRISLSQCQNTCVPSPFPYCSKESSYTEVCILSTVARLSFAGAAPMYEKKHLYLGNCTMPFFGVPDPNTISQGYNLAQQDKVQHLFAAIAMPKLVGDAKKLCKAGKGVVFFTYQFGDAVGCRHVSIC